MRNIMNIISNQLKQLHFTVIYLEKVKFDENENVITNCYAVYTSNVIGRIAFTAFDIAHMAINVYNSLGCLEGSIPANQDLNNIMFLLGILIEKTYSRD